MKIVRSRTIILVIIVLAQFACVSIWFAVNGVMEDLINAYHLKPGSLGHLTSFIQIGFIAGTLFYSVFSIADRFSPVKVFFISAVLSGICNLGPVVISGNSIFILYCSRFAAGFFIAGVYPVGMKIISDYY